MGSKTAQDRHTIKYMIWTLWSILRSLPHGFWQGRVQTQDTRGHWGDGTGTVSLPRVNCHCPVRTGILPAEFVYSLILISGESSGLHPAANWFNKQHLGLEEENMILQWEHVTETSISGYDLGLLQRAAQQRDSFKRQERIQSKCKKQLPTVIWRLLMGKREITTVPNDDPKHRK